jgi:hemerythrin
LHREAHRELTEDLLRLQDRHLSATAPSAVVYGQMCDFLENWLNHHMLLVDMAYRDYFESKGFTTPTRRKHPL